MSSWNKKGRGFIHVQRPKQSVRKRQAAGVPSDSSHARAREREQGVNKRAEFFTVAFYGLKSFGCKTARFCATHCESGMTNYLAEATVCNTVKTSAKNLSRIRNPLLYPAELRAHNRTYTAFPDE
jgi:hypothetical protein